MSINDKIKQVLLLKNLSPSYLADDIGVQRSSISHILSGRNRPSLDIIQKIVRRFPEFTYDWFLEADVQLSTDDHVPSPPPTSKPQPNVTENNHRTPVRDNKTTGFTHTAKQENTAVHQNETIIPKQLQTPNTTIDRILIFYTDGTFREYAPQHS